MASFTDNEKSIMGSESGVESSVSQNKSLPNELNSYFHTFTLSFSQKKALEEALLASPLKPATDFLFLRKFFRYLNEKVFLNSRANEFFLPKSLLFSHFTTAVVAIVITFCLAYNFKSQNEPLSHDLISEVISLSDNLNFPADFNLDGNLNDLPALIQDSLPSHSFSPSVPQQIAQDFSAYEGRFFLFNGEQGVGISVLPSSQTNSSSVPSRLQQSFAPKQTSTLYIVKLSDKNKSSFPSQKMSRKIYSASGKIKRVYAWRDGTYGYAMVQPLGFEESDLNLK